MRETKYETVEIVVDTELLEQLKQIIEPMGCLLYTSDAADEL